jgi:hypothetical protein
VPRSVRGGSVTRGCAYDTDLLYEQCDEAVATLPFLRVDTAEEMDSQP